MYLGKTMLVTFWVLVEMLLRLVLSTIGLESSFRP
jgi:hypothetical protein